MVRASLPSQPRTKAAAESASGHYASRGAWGSAATVLAAGGLGKELCVRLISSPTLGRKAARLPLLGSASGPAEDQRPRRWRCMPRKPAEPWSRESESRDPGERRPVAAEVSRRSLECMAYAKVPIAEGRRPRAAMKQTNGTEIEDIITASLRREDPDIERIGIHHDGHGWRCHRVWLAKHAPRLSAKETEVNSRKGEPDARRSPKRARDRQDKAAAASKPRRHYLRVFFWLSDLGGASADWLGQDVAGYRAGPVQSPPMVGPPQTTRRQ
jgi:hypothetical protein